LFHCVRVSRRRKRGETRKSAEIFAYPTARPLAVRIVVVTSGHLENPFNSSLRVMTT
jgi:hypothetical protein